MSTSLWPNFSAMNPPRGMKEMLYEMAGDLAQQTNNKLDFYVDIVGVERGGPVREVRYNCYVKVARTDDLALLFRVTTPVASPFPASIVTPEDDEYPDLRDEASLRSAVEQVLARERTKEVVLYLRNIA